MLKLTSLSLLAVVSCIAISPGVSSPPVDPHFMHIPGLELTASQKVIRFPDIMGYKTLTADLHMHTIFSDGEVTPRVRVLEAWHEGLDAISITDHDFAMRSYIQGDYNTSYELARPLAEQMDVILIHGLEYTRSKPIGHWNFLFIEDGNRYVNTEMSHEEVFKLASDDGAFIMYNHPGWPDQNSDLSSFQVDMINKGYVQGMEVINGTEFYPMAIDHCKQYGLAPMGTTDIHGPIHSSYDVENGHRNLTLVFAEERSHDAIKEALFARRTLAYANNILAGESEYVFALMRASLEVQYADLDAFRFSVTVRNNSDITWVLDGPGHSKIVFPANQVVRLNDQKQHLEIVYQVSNTYVSSGDHLDVSLFDLLTNDDEVLMPQIRQDLIMISPQTLIELNCLTPGVEIRFTTNGSEPTASSTLYTGPFTMEASGVIKARAFKEGMKPSRTFSRQAIVDVLHQGERLTRPKNGVHYRYFEGAFQSVDEMEEAGKLIREGVLDSFDITSAEAGDYFGFIFTGFVYAPTDGLYTFILESDDGSTLEVSGVELINNDGSHSLKRESGSIKLRRGYHPYVLRYFDDYAEEALNVYWIRPGGAEERVNIDGLFIR